MTSSPTPTHNSLSTTVCARHHHHHHHHRSLRRDVKLRLLIALVWSVGLYGSESWTLKAANRKRIEGFEMTAYRRLLRVSWTKHRTNALILEELRPPIRLLHTVCKRKLQYVGHVVRARNLCRPTHILEERIAGDGPRGRPARRWTDDTRDWSAMSVAHCTQTARNRQQWRQLVHCVISDWGRNATECCHLSDRR